MVKHIVLWNFVDTLTKEERDNAYLKMKELLVPIKDLVPGAVEIQVVKNELESSNKDVALISTFETEEALKAYQVHPAHVEAGKFVCSVTCDRACLDYEVM